MRWAKEAYCNNDIKVVFSCEVKSMNADYVENIIRNIDIPISASWLMVLGALESPIW